MQAKQGDTVKVHYTGKLDDGSIFDSSREGDALEFRIGENSIIPGFEQAVIGMRPGESKSMRIPVAEAYGPYQDELVEEVERAMLPEDMEPEVGLRLRARRPDGLEIVLTVTEVGAETVTLDANHPLAGEDLTFDIELVAVG
jgi:peptidylprolyl isomerase